MNATIGRFIRIIDAGNDSIDVGNGIIAPGNNSIASGNGSIALVIGIIGKERGSFDGSHPFMFPIEELVEAGYCFYVTLINL
jgi:hypothetical protein